MILGMKRLQSHPGRTGVGRDRAQGIREHRWSSGQTQRCDGRDASDAIKTSKSELISLHRLEAGGGGAVGNGNNS